MTSTANTPAFKALLVVLAAAALLGWNYAFVPDEGYAVFTYARNFASGDGLVWYPGWQGFGYSSFLFTLVLGMLMWFGIAAELASHLISFPAYLGSIWLVFHIARLLSPSLVVAVIASLALATHLTFSAYATGGSEISLQVFLVLGAYYQWLQWQRHHRQTLLYFSIFSALALLTRLDSILLLLPAYILLATHDKKMMARAAAAPAAAMLALLLFCSAYYGQALPTGLERRLSSGWQAGQGLAYLSDYLRAQAFIPLILLLWWGLTVRKQERSLQAWQGRLLLLSPAALWLLYVIITGGDSAEYRFIIPALPFFYLVMVDDILKGSRMKLPMIAMVLAAVIFIGNSTQRHSLGYGFSEAGVESIQQLRYWVRGQNSHWVRTGRLLNRLFYTDNRDENIIIATAAPGAISYYSRLKTIDQGGIHTRQPAEQMKDVHLQIDHPIYFKWEEDGYYHCLAQPVSVSHRQLRRIKPVLVRLQRGHYLLAYYLRPHPTLQKMIKREIIIRYSDVADKVRCGGRFTTPALD